MAGSLKTDAVIVRSIRYAEADRILHAYTPAMGRISAIAKGVRRPRSRFGGRLEPFTRVGLVLHQGRSDLMTVTGASTLDAHPRIRTDGRALEAAAHAAQAVSRLLDSAEPNAAAYHLLARYLQLLDDPALQQRTAAVSGRIAFRLKLALATGFGPELASCASCGEADHLTGFSGAAGGVVCSACEAAAFPLSAEAHRLLVDALAAPLAEVPEASQSAERQADRAVREVLEHHANVRIRSAA
ncbi:MAG: DNA repair protein RecO [Solirubrobacterales bacterium]